GRPAEGLVTEDQRLAEDDDPPEKRHPGGALALGGPRERVATRYDLAVVLARRNPPGGGGAHHHPFDYCMASDGLRRVYLAARGRFTRLQTPPRCRPP